MTRDKIKTALEYIKSTDKETSQLGITLIDSLDMSKHLMDISIECNKMDLVIVENCKNYAEACTKKFGSTSPGLYNVYEKMKTKKDHNDFDEFITDFLNKAFSQNTEKIEFKTVKLNYLK